MNHQHLKSIFRLSVVLFYTITAQNSLGCPEDIRVDHSKVNIVASWTEPFYKFNDVPFYRDKWVIDKVSGPCYDQHTEGRYSMVIDLIEHHHIFELTAAELKALLGIPNHEQLDLLCYVIYVEQYRHSYRVFSVQFLIEKEKIVAVRIHSSLDEDGQSGWCRPNKPIVLDPKRPTFLPHNWVPLQESE